MFNSSQPVTTGLVITWKRLKVASKKKQNFVKIEVSYNPMFYGKLYSQVDKLYYWNDPTQQLFLKFQMQGIVEQITATIPEDQNSSTKSLKLSTRLWVASEPKV